MKYHAMTSELARNKKPLWMVTKIWGRDLLKERVMVVIEKLLFSIRLDICYRNHVVEESMDHGIDQVLIYASV
uniref:Uncharacterized protein n=1 Tax=Cucumis melo TaxID=3656 RepID=A0A9I9EG54_CUCME